MQKLKKVLKILSISIGLIVAVTIVAFVVMLLRQVTPEQAQVASQKHFDDVKSKVASVPGYKIVREAKPSFIKTRDEIGSSDYSLSASFLVQKSSVAGADDVVKLDRADITNFAARLPGNEYGISVENTPLKVGRPVLLCVSASRYLNDDGTYVPQGSTENSGKFIEQSQFEQASGQAGAGVVSRCADILF